MSRMYGTPHQTYAVLNNVFYRADGNGLITNVAQGDVQALADQGCMSEDQWLKVQAAHPGGANASVGSSGTAQMANGSGGFLASQITDTGSRVILANRTIGSPAATPITLLTDTGVVLGSPTGGIQGPDTANAAG